MAWTVVDREVTREDFPGKLWFRESLLWTCSVASAWAAGMSCLQGWWFQKSEHHLMWEQVSALAY